MNAFLHSFASVLKTSLRKRVASVFVAMAPVRERRVAMDGHRYTLEEFVGRYGWADGESSWAASGDTSDRVACSGILVPATCVFELIFGTYVVDICVYMCVPSNAYMIMHEQDLCEKQFFRRRAVTHMCVRYGGARSRTNVSNSFSAGGP